MQCIVLVLEIEFEQENEERRRRRILNNFCSSAHYLAHYRDCYKQRQVSCLQ